MNLEHKYYCIFFINYQIKLACDVRHKQVKISIDLRRIVIYFDFISFL